jgi:uncharacterized membrane protein YccC
VFKRLFWLVVGLALGAGLALLAVRRLQRYRPDALAADAAENLRRFAEELRAAIGEGRAAMVETEAAIRADLGERPRPTRVPVADS